MLGTNRLQRDAALERFVDAGVDLAHAAGPERMGDTVMGDRCFHLGAGLSLLHFHTIASRLEAQKLVTRGRRIVMREDRV